MTDAKARIIFLTGSPLTSSLSWSEAALSSPLLACFEGHTQFGIKGLSRPSAEDVAPRWRHLPLERQHLPTGLTQASYAEWLNNDHFIAAHEEHSLTPTDLNDRDSTGEPVATEQSRAERDLIRFYEHSFAIHEETDLDASRGLESNESSLNNTFDTSLEDSGLRDNDDEAQIALVKARLSKVTLTNLKEVPSARHLRSIAPQTVTVDLVVGVISVSHPKTILTRRNRFVDLVQLIVGDETSAGFAINIWLDVQKVNGEQSLTKYPITNDLRSQVVRLRPRDIIFARNVALGSFRDKVSGQSLRRGVTSLDLLYRNIVDATDHRGILRSREIEDGPLSDAKLAKVKRTKDWVANFVGGTKVQHQGSRNMEESIASLPEDTQSISG